MLTGLADIIFPPRCLTCDTTINHNENLSICPSCFSKIKFIKSPLCVCCGIPFSVADESNHLCGNCLISKPSFSFARAVGYYETTFLEAIHKFKYQGKITIGKMMGRLMAGYDYPFFSISEFTLIIPVPLHAKRLRERGFNQSMILAREIAKRFLIPLDFLILKRYIHTASQIHLGKKEREANVRGAFEVTYPEKISDKKIILVDDVYTTGTM